MLDQTSFNALGLCDSRLTAIEWCADGKDLSIVLAHVSGQEIKLACSWAHERRIALDTPAQHGGMPLVWEATLATEGREYRLHLDFASDGSISLLCGEVSVVQQA
jgi:hypothetical protein